jgi:Tol biopolymer transport system component
VSGKHEDWSALSLESHASKNESPPDLMTPERWLQIKEIFTSALAIAPVERSDFLLKACGSDEKLRKEIESLIVAHELTGSFIDSPAYKVAEKAFATPNLTPGQRIGHYEIVSKIGRGGMGEVYLARDLNLGRDVALKFLSSDFTQSFERLQRFQQEARAASGLNHPNILTVYEIANADGHQFIATEFIEGETLRTRLVIGRLPLTEVLNIAEQVASSLSAAHAKGIVHRDIKPENIMLRTDGFVKVLDFGLAKLTESEEVGPEESTIAMVRTATGIVMGTTAYMSPEQTRGFTVDSRTDIWSLGAVMYEMLTGKPPFQGETSSDVMAAVLEREPVPLTELVIGLPTELQRIVRKALRKNREERYQSIKDLQSDIKDLKQELTSTLPHVPKSTEKTKRGWQIPFIAIAILTLAIAAIGVYKIANPKVVPTTNTTQIVGTSQLTTWPGLDLDPAISPDGNAVAYSSDHLGNFEVFIKPLTPGAREIQLTSDGQQNFQPAWSPDGKLIAFHSKNRGGIFVIPASGGTSRQIAEFGSHPIWSPDGSSILFQSEEVNDLGASSIEAPMPPSTLRIVDVGRGETRSLTQVGVPVGGHGDASWSPDGKRIVFVSYDGTEAKLWNISSTGTDLHQVIDRVRWIYSPTYSPDGQHIYFGGVSETGGFALYEVAVSPADGKANSEPVEILNGGLGRIKQLSISSNGKKIVYSAPSMRGNISSVTLSASAMSPAGAPIALTNDTSYRKGLARFSPDGQRIVFVEFRGGTNQDIWVSGADGSNPVQLTTNPAIDWAPSWLPDNDTIAFQSDRGGRGRVWTISIRSGQEKLLVDPQQQLGWPSVSPDGKQIVFNSTRSGTTNLWMIPTSGGPAEQLTFDKEMMGFGSWSRDGTTLAFEVKHGLDQQIAIMPSSGGPLTELTSGPGLSWPFSWSPDGDKIAFSGLRNNYWNVYWVSRTTREQKQLTFYKKLNAFVRYPEWNPTGKRIIYEYSESTGNVWLMELK